MGPNLQFNFKKRNNVKTKYAVSVASNFDDNYLSLFAIYRFSFLATLVTYIVNANVSHTVSNVNENRE